MITERNGLLVFPRGEDHSAHPVVLALESVSLGDVRFPYGFFLVEAGGKRYVLPGSEDERMQRLRKAFPEQSDELLSRPCRLDGVVCRGECDDPYHCSHVAEPGDQWYGCVCLPLVW